MRMNRDKMRAALEECFQRIEHVTGRMPEQEFVFGNITISQCVGLGYLARCRVTLVVTGDTEYPLAREQEERKQ